MNPSASFVGRVVRVLSSESCSAIRFSIGTELRIQRYMYAYVANAVKENRIHLWFDDSTTNNYDHRTDT
ncbi:MAG: hypothetical protein KDA89_03875, partial [Planctomycetaceae bacterium]|nr:hypothetical protein [Planctomycetaceae bacterium]